MNSLLSALSHNALQHARRIIRGTTLQRPLGRVLTATLVTAVLAGPAFAGAQLSGFPERADPSHTYIIYLHGRIIESEGTGAVSPRFGAYDYDAIVDALADGGADVIADVRVGDTDVFDYSERLAGEITALMEQGVPAENITVAGFSKGGYMTLLVANELQNPAIRYVVMAGCTEGIVDGRDDVADGLQGTILSLVDQADDLGFPCTPLFERNPQLDDTGDIIFDADTGHGFFYRADPLWIDEVQSWSMKEAN